MSRGRMIASKFEYRYRFWLIAFVFVVAYSFYNLDHVNVLYAVVAFGDDAHLKDLPVRMLCALSALLAGIGATMLTWVAAYRSVSANKGESQKTDFCISGPFRYVRNPHYLGYFLLLAGLSSFQSRLGFPVMAIGETILLLRLVGREEMQLEQAFGERYRDYQRCVPRLLFSFSPRIAAGSQQPCWSQALGELASPWALVATLVAFACTLSDPVGYAFAGAALLIFVLQKAFQAAWIRPRHS
jgi:protein-S-isoprenylcysteine O-methyltransferase Ste14